MEALIPAINKIQDIFHAVGAEDSVELPQIIVVGEQSSGKSSMLESLVGKSFLPRGPDIVTRCPTVLQLNHVSKREAKEKGRNEWVEFLHIPDRIFTDFDEVRDEIEKETVRKAGRHKAIVSDAIHLSVYSTQVVSLTVVDLPGIVKVAAPGQDDNIEVQIKKLISDYIKNPNSIILAVSPASTHIQNSEGLKAAKEVDPNGDRTLVVITKMDLMTEDIQEVLWGRIVPVKLGIIGVVCRSQADINSGKTLREVLVDESNCIREKLPTALANRNGIPYLSKVLNSLLMRHIQACLPKLEARINGLILSTKRELALFGNEVENKSEVLVEGITKFSRAYSAAIVGRSRHIDSSTLCGGARISYLFMQTLDNDLAKIDPLNGMTNSEILTAIRNSKGIESRYFVPEEAFQNLVKLQILRLEEPILRCAQLTHQEMLSISENCVRELGAVLSRFPRLTTNIIRVVTDILKERQAETERMLRSYVAVQSSFVYTNNRGFLNEMDKLLKGLVLQPRVLQKDVQNIGEPAAGATENKPEMNPFLEPEIPAKLQQNGEQSGGRDDANSDSEDDTKSMSSAKQNRRGKVFPGVIQDFELYDPVRWNMKECAVIKQLCTSYFELVKTDVKDYVPKAIVQAMIYYMEDNLLDKLITTLHTEEKIQVLTEISESAAKSRDKTADTLNALEKAAGAIAEVRDAAAD